MPNPYDSLLLSCGGGIINTAQQSPQHKGSAALAIGIGGTGVAALAALKKKVYQQLEPDNPNESVPRYDHIQFLAIDSDTSDIEKMRGKGKLDKDSEFFSISNPNLRTALSEKNQIKNNPLLNWMDIDRINNLLSPQGAGGVRQVGRFLLISKANQLKTKIEQKCITALSGMQTQSLDIYIFAGISGGTGSGCFIDTCYIVRQALEENGWTGSGNIMGLFFLPDVVLNKPAVKAVRSSVQYNSSNGYAAMKELDYLMSLKTANDRFYQNYGNFRVDTQDPPVDMCHLISACKADGTLLDDGFSYCINVASDYVMTYLAQVQMPQGENANDEKGLTMRGHLSNVNNGVTGLQRDHGSELTYHILGAAAAEIPMTQISTYLTAGFFNKFVSLVGKEKKPVTKSDVDNLLRELKITAKDIQGAVGRDTAQFNLPDMDIPGLKQYCPVPRGYLPAPWATAHEMWLDGVAGKFAQNAAALSEDLPKGKDRFTYEKITDDSLIGRMFRKLFELSKDPNYGPFYASRFLKCEGYDVVSAVEGIITELKENKKTKELWLNGTNGVGGNEDRLFQASSDFSRKANKKCYAEYTDAVREHAVLCRDIKCLTQSINLMQKFREKVVALSTDFYKPFCDFLDNLEATFAENGRYLTSPEAKAPTAYTWRIFELEDVKEHLDSVIEQLNAKQLVNDFIEYLLNRSEDWISKDEGKISKCISEYMVNMPLFSVEVNRSLEAFLYDKYPHIMKGNAQELSEQVKRDIIERLNRQATPMFWCNPSFNIENTFRSSSISVPSRATAVCAAADSFAAANTEYVVRKTGLNDRIFASRFYSGIPFYAYKGTTLLRDFYNQGASADYGLGAHLFSKTERGNDGTGMKDWRSFLPIPTAYSLEPEAVTNGKDIETLYNNAEEKGVIQRTPTLEYVIVQSKPLNIKDYTKEDFMRSGNVLDEGELEKTVSMLKDLLSNMHSLTNPENQKIEIKNNGAVGLGETVVNRVRLDYFMHYPLLQKIAREELDKRARVENMIESLNAIREEQKHFEDELTGFCYQIFFKQIECANGEDMPEYDKISQIYCDYIDEHGAEATYNFLKELDDKARLSGDYPLYVAFKNFSKLDREEAPRKILEEKLNTEHYTDAGLKLVQGDNVIAHKLFDIWNAKALGALEKKVDTLPETTKAEILQFYRSMVRAIMQFKDKFSTDGWNYVPAPRMLTLWDSQGQRYLYIYEQYGLDKAYDQATGQWVTPLNPGTMLVYNAVTQGWEAMTLNSHGKITNK